MKTNTKTIAYIGLLTALAVILMFFPHFPILPAFPFLRIDFSDVPALLAAVTVSPVFALIIEFIKNLFHLTVSDTALIGELSNFIVGTSFALSLGITSKYMFKNMLMRKKLIFTLILSALIELAVSLLSNRFIIAPLYFGNDVKAVTDYIIYGCLPFNAIKDVLQAVTFYIVYVTVYPRIKVKMY